jgi:hypothetical protein
MYKYITGQMVEMLHDRGIKINREGLDVDKNWFNRFLEYCNDMAFTANSWGEESIVQGVIMELGKAVATDEEFQKERDAILENGKEFLSKSDIKEDHRHKKIRSFIEKNEHEIEKVKEQESTDNKENK